MFILILSAIAHAEQFKASKKANYEIVQKINRPSDIMFFTEGLSFVDDDTILESTGLYGDSEIHYIKDFFEAPTLDSRHGLAKQYFGEGCSKVNDKNGNSVFMMTYKERKVFKFNGDLSKIVQTFDIPEDIKEGWGMTYRSKDNTLIVSDGTNILFHVDPTDFTIKKKVSVLAPSGKGLMNINELELYENDTVLANIYGTPYIAQINIEDGALQDIWNFEALIDDVESVKGKGFTDPYFDKVLNGIAYRNGRLILGGKKWPFFYEVKMTN